MSMYAIVFVLSRDHDVADLQVRDLAHTIYASIDKKATGRYPVCNGVFDYQGLANRAKELYPELDKAEKIPIGNPEDLPSKKTYTLDASKVEKELGVKCELHSDPTTRPSADQTDIPLEQTLKDIVDQFIALGALKP
jgi:hypothetical protein